MPIQVESVSSVKRRIVVTVEPDRVTNKRRTLMERLRRQAQIKGFRPGKAPMSLIERYYGEHVGDEIKADLLQEALDEAIEQNAMRIVSHPEIESSTLTDEGSFEAVAIVEVYPSVEPKNYESLNVRRRRIAVSDEEVRQRLTQLAQMRAQLQTVEGRSAASGDVVDIDYAGTIEGVAFEGGTDRNYLLTLGSNTFIPGFEDGLVGVSAGEERSLNLTFPENYNKAELAGREVVFAVKVNGIKERVVPALDDEFAKDLGAEFETLDQLMAHERTVLMRDMERQARDFDRRHLIDALIAANEVEAPDSMVKKQIASMKEQLRHNLAYSGIPREQVDNYLRDADDNIRPDAEREVKGALLLDAIATKENVAVSDEDMENHFVQLAETYRQTPAEIAAYYHKNDQIEGLRYRLVEDKTIEMLLAKAEVEWVDGDEDGGEEAPADADESRE
jgi:trigger factor